MTGGAMGQPPVVELPNGPIELPPLGEDLEGIWDALFQIADAWPTDWTLVGGQMSFSTLSNSGGPRHG